MNNEKVVTAPPKRTVKAMSRAQLKKELEGTGITTSKKESKEEMKVAADKIRNAPAAVSEYPEFGEY